MNWDWVPKDDDNRTFFAIIAAGLALSGICAAAVEISKNLSGR